MNDATSGTKRLRRLAVVVAERDTYKNALERIAACPAPNSIEDCHNEMSDIAKRALQSAEATDG